MPTTAPNPDAIGILTVDYTLAQKTSRSVKTSPVEPLLDQTGAAVQGATTGQDGEWEIEGLGDLPDTLALGDSAVNEGADPGMNGVTGGKILCLSLMEGDQLKGWNTWKASGEHCPDAA